MPGGAALLTQASLPHCNTGSLIRYNKRGNEVRQRGERLGKAFERRRLCGQNGSLSSEIMSEQLEKNYHTHHHTSTVKTDIRSSPYGGKGGTILI